MHVKRGDQVIVISGNDKGRVGEVKQVFVRQNRVIVEEVNLRVKHMKPTQQKPQGERVRQECWIHASNVLLVDPQTGKGTRKRPAKE